MEIGTKVFIKEFNQDCLYLGKNKYYLLNDEVLKELNMPVQMSCSNEIVWVGIQYNSIKLLINLKSMDIEMYNIVDDDWYYLEDQFYFLDSENNILEIIFDCFDSNSELKLKLDLSTLECFIKTVNGLEYEKYNNYLVGHENDCLFNEYNQLELIKGDE